MELEWFGDVIPPLRPTPAAGTSEFGAEEVGHPIFRKKIKFGVRIFPVVVGHGGGSEVLLKCTGGHRGRKNFWKWE
jgi:hypothetical protein